MRFDRSIHEKHECCGRRGIQLKINAVQPGIRAFRAVDSTGPEMTINRARTASSPLRQCLGQQFSHQRIDPAFVGKALRLYLLD